MQHVDHVKATNAWDSSPRLLDLLKRKIIRVYEAFTVRLILIYLELCCTLDFTFSCMLFTVWKHVLRAVRCLISVGFWTFIVTAEDVGKVSRKFLVTALMTDRNTQSAQVGSLLAVNRKVHIFYQWCAILMKGQFLESVFDQFEAKRGLKCFWSCERQRSPEVHKVWCFNYSLLKIIFGFIQGWTKSPKQHSQTKPTVPQICPTPKNPPQKNHFKL